jgi:Protein of unknown function (DUF2877)
VNAVCDSARPAPRATAGGLEALGQLRHGGRVLARYERVLVLESTAGRLLAVHGPELPPCPFSLVLPFGLVLGGAPPADAGVELVAGVSARPLRWPVARGRPTAASLAQACATLAPMAAESTFGESGPASAVAGIVRRRGAAALAELGHAAREGRLERALAAADALLGLGPGATPSGDDALVGFLGAWLRLGSPPRATSAPAAAGASAPPDLAQHVAAALDRGARGRTTRLAAEFYVYLARGRLSRTIDALLCAIAAGRPESVRAAAATLARFGATSGRDTLAGIRAYVQLAVARRPRCGLP